VSVVAPPPLALTPGTGQTVNEGASATIGLGSIGGGVGPYSVTVTWGDGTSSTFAAAGGAISAAHTYANEGTYSVSVKVTDSTSASATGSFSVTVKNVAPTVAITTPSAGTIFKIGSSFTLSATFSDAGKSDTHTCKVTWGDGTTSTGTVSETNGAGTCTASHSYANVGSYTITVTVTDNGAAAGTATVAVSASRNGHTLFQPGGGAVETLIIAPAKTKLAVAKTTKKTHKTIAKKKALSNAALLAKLRRVLRFEPMPAPRL
jgi:hypothetical protein